MKAAIKRIVLMLQFFTRIPINLRLGASAEDYGKGLVFAPLVGLVIGALLGTASFVLLHIFSRSMTAAVILVLYIAITGGLHLDGLGDTFDGLFSNRTRERILEIMRDSRVGTNAVLVIVSVLLLDYAALSQVSDTYFFRIIILMPMTGRAGSLVSSAVSTYARKEEGLGKSFIDFCGIKELIFGLLIYVIISLLTLDFKMWIALALPPVSAFLLIKAFSRKIGGATGDMLGAVCELNQCIFLIFSCAFLG
ncbi:cobalamin-5'-phosphate synthase [Ruminiclostridium sufflavum DSM 19573]|uniref:Adenosylcobinamide-GDP ribazoletransferase n=1 Tax=Ruminiclostridium sufflavum DSM 19573 TaxID=1121337 RepID=A0A318XGX2_9FIRM|nr:adenosylcobinamide-GDP ribazoletransferase [Ruminiclostridium sufflavum]PYG85805.1 cobalamin-5'-phosphate synthase [Ruminiclostridium sufflavum DSM 19573]